VTVTRARAPLCAHETGTPATMRTRAICTAPRALVAVSNPLASVARVCSDQEWSAVRRIAHPFLFGVCAGQKKGRRGWSGPVRPRLPGRVDVEQLGLSAFARLGQGLLGAWDLKHPASRGSRQNTAVRAGLLALWRGWLVPAALGRPGRFTGLPSPGFYRNCPDSEE
jgi:hypothetical protein